MLGGITLPAAGYDTALICLNGHVVNTAFHHNSMSNQHHCEKCGEKTVTQCPSCNQEIRGVRYWIQQSYVDARHGGSHTTFDTRYELPKFCLHCGTAYPWTDKRIQTLREYIINITELSEDDKQLLLNNLSDLIKSTPRSDLAASYWKKILDNKEGIAKIVYEIGKEYLPSVIFSSNSVPK